MGEMKRFPNSPFTYESKVCISCGKEKPITDFYHDGKKKATGERYRRASCSVCFRIRYGMAPTYKLKGIAK